MPGIRTTEARVRPKSSEFLRALGELLGVGEQDIVPDANRRKNTLIFTVIGTLVLLAFAVANVLEHDQSRLNQLGWLQLAEVVFLLIPGRALTYRGTRPIWAENMLVVSGFIIFTSINVYGGHTGDSPYWTFAYPYLVFFLRGQKVGWTIGLSFATGVPTLMYYSSVHWDLWKYEPMHCVFYGISYAFNVLTAAYFNLLRSIYQKTLMDQVAFNTAEVRRHLDTLRYNATHDQTTGLLNRQGLLEALDSELTWDPTARGHLHIVALSLLRVAELVGIVGVDKVDASIRVLAERLREHFPFVVCVARVGHDKLVLVMQGPTSTYDVVYAAHAIRSLSNSANSANSANGGAFSLHVDYLFGVAVEMLPVTGGRGDLLRRAEQALLSAGHNGLDYQIYDAVLSDHLIEKNVRYEKLRGALESAQLTLFYQPQVDLKTGKVSGAEALARWYDRDEGMILPGKFIPLIESTGLLHRFSIWSVEAAIRDCAGWQGARPGVSVSINLSAGALLDSDVLLAFENALKRYELDPALVVVELTESVLLRSPEVALEKIAHLLQLGARLSIDDYGAGFSSLTYLKQLPAHEMKIDMSFVRQLASSSKDQAIVASSIDLGHDLQLTVLAEGIEDVQALKILMAARCDLGQGWYFSRALPLKDFMDWSPPDFLSEVALMQASTHVDSP